MNLGTTISTIRKPLMKQCELASKVGISQTYMSQIESGRKIPGIELIEAICIALDIPVFALIWLSSDWKDVPVEKFGEYMKVKDDIYELIRRLL